MLLATLLLLLVPLSQLLFLMNLRGYYSYRSIIQKSLILSKKCSTNRVSRSFDSSISDQDDQFGARATKSFETVVTSAPRRPKIIFVLGGPGAGKGTQCAKLAAEFGIKHLSAGELLREEKLKPTENGRLIDSYLKEGKIVPVEISLNLLRGAIEQLRWNRYLIDGFPRNWDNLQGWDRIMSDVVDVESILFIECDETELARRLISRGLFPYILTVGRKLPQALLHLLFIFLILLLSLLQLLTSTNYYYCHRFYFYDTHFNNTCSTL